jgi:hypothetical protein
MKSEKMNRSDDNQAEVRTRGHVETNSDPYINAADGTEISRATNFGIEHYGFVKDSEGLNQTK